MKRNEKPMKERILEEALQLFSQNGYTGTSMNDIAAKLGVTKAALYKHYKSKQEILDSIVEKASEYGLPEEQQGEDFLSERQVSYDDIKTYTKEQFSYLAKGPVSYMEPIFEQLTKDSQKARQLVLDFYGPIFLLYSIYDGAEEKESVVDILDRHVDSFSQIFQQKATAVK